MRRKGLILKKNLFISDLDHTLLNNEGKLSEFSRNTLNNLISKGLNFTIASARSYSSIKQILDGLHLKLPIIEFNGSFVTDYTTGKHIYVNEISNKVATQVLKICHEMNHPVFVSSYDGNNDLLFYPESDLPGVKWYVNNRIENKDKRLKKMIPDEELLKLNTICFSIINKESALQELYTVLQNKFGNDMEIHLIENPYSPGNAWLTCHDKNSSKDKAIEQLKSLMGMSDFETIVFGDNMNDLKMIDNADIGVAIGNAVQEIKDIADCVIGINENDSVVKYIKEHV